MTKASGIESRYSIQNMLDDNFKQHCKKLAIADPGSSVRCLAKLDPDTVVIFQKSSVQGVPVKGVKLALVDRSIEADIGTRSYDHINDDLISAALKADSRLGKSSSSKFTQIDLTEIDKLMEKMKSLKSAFELHLGKVTEKDLTTDIWLNRLSELQREMAATAVSLKEKLASAMIVTSQKTTHFQSDYYRMIETQQSNFKHYGTIVTRLNNLKIKNDELRNKCKAKLEQFAADSIDPAKADMIERSTTDASKFVNIVKNSVASVVGN